MKKFMLAAVSAAVLVLGATTAPVAVATEAQEEPLIKFAKKR